MKHRYNRFPIRVVYYPLTGSLAARGDHSFLEFSTLHDATPPRELQCELLIQTLLLLCQGRNGMLLYFDDVSFLPCHCSH